MSTDITCNNLVNMNDKSSSDFEVNTNFGEIDYDAISDVDIPDEYFEEEKSNSELWQSLDSLIKEINEPEDKGELYSFGDHVVETIVDSILGPFGLSKAMFDENTKESIGSPLLDKLSPISDKDGGPVTTGHNAGKGIFARDEEKYVRSDYDFNAKQRKDILDSKRDSSGVVHGGYTGNPVDEGNIDLDHEYPAYAYHKYAGWMQTKEQRKAFGTDPRNLNPQESSLNRSKGAKETSTFEGKPNKDNPDQTNKEAYKMDDRRVRGCENRSRKAVEEHAPTTKERIEYHAKQIGIQGAKTAFSVATRRALGVAIKMLVEEGWASIKEGIRRMKQGLIKNVKEFLRFVVERMENVKERLIDTLKEMCKSFVEGGVAGFVSVLITFVINSFITTAKRIVTVIREAVLTFTRVIRALAEKGKSVKDKMSNAGYILMDGLKVLIAGVLIEATKKFLETTPLNPLAETMSQVLVNICIGLVGIMILYFIMQHKAKIEKEQRRLELEEKLFNVSVLGNTIAIQSAYSTSSQIERTIKIFENAFQSVVVIGKEWESLYLEGIQYDEMTDNRIEEIVQLQTSQQEKLSRLRNKINNAN